MTTDPIPGDGPVPFRPTDAALDALSRSVDALTEATGWERDEVHSILCRLVGQWWTGDVLDPAPLYADERAAIWRGERHATDREWSVTFAHLEVAERNARLTAAAFRERLEQTAHVSAAARLLLDLHPPLDEPAILRDRYTGPVFG